MRSIAPTNLTKSRHALNAWRLFVLSQRKWTSGGAPLLVGAGQLQRLLRGHTRLQSASELIKQEIYFAMQKTGCDVQFDNLTRQLYATDASIYQIEPNGADVDLSTRQNRLRLRKLSC